MTDNCGKCKFYSSSVKNIVLPDLDEPVTIRQKMCNRYPKRTKIDEDYWCGEFVAKVKAAVLFEDFGQDFDWGHINKEISKINETERIAELKAALNESLTKARNDALKKARNTPAEGE
jgi:hypothetical protein